jgi:superoxide dismutase
MQVAGQVTPRYSLEGSAYAYDYRKLKRVYMENGRRFINWD